MWGIMLTYKQSITSLPVYNDGCFKLFEIKQTDDKYAIEYLHDTGKPDIWFEELSISDRLKFDAEERKKKITYKLRIPQMKEINSLCVRTLLFASFLLLEFVFIFCIGDVCI